MNLEPNDLCERMNEFCLSHISLIVVMDMKSWRRVVQLPTQLFPTLPLPQAQLCLHLWDWSNDLHCKSRVHFQSLEKYWSPTGLHNVKCPFDHRTGLCMVPVEPGCNCTSRHCILVSCYECDGSWLQGYPPSIQYNSLQVTVYEHGLSLANQQICPETDAGDYTLLASKQNKTISCWSTTEHLQCRAWFSYRSDSHGCCRSPGEC